MKLTSCPRCERHVLVEAASCPFCGTRLGTTSAIGRVMMVAMVGLSMSCGGGDDTGDTVGNTEGVTSQGPTNTSEPIETDAGGNDYAGPETSISGGSTTTGEVEEESSDSTDTDTGDTTAGSSSDGGGNDYAGPGTDTGDTAAGSSSDGGGNDYAGPGVQPQ
jgi:hypothetical protein